MERLFELDLNICLYCMGDLEEPKSKANVVPHPPSCSTFKVAWPWALRVDNAWIPRMNLLGIRWTGLWDVSCAWIQKKWTKTKQRYNKIISLFFFFFSLFLFLFYSSLLLDQIPTGSGFCFGLGSRTTSSLSLGWVEWTKALTPPFCFSFFPFLYSPSFLG